MKRGEFRGKELTNLKKKRPKAVSSPKGHSAFRAKSFECTENSAEKKKERASKEEHTSEKSRENE